jgi:hypothetical protein
VLKDQIKTVPEYYGTYIDLAPNNDLLVALPNGGIHLYEENLEMLKKLGFHVYAENKWTTHQIIEHLIDTERIFQTRALRIARNDKTPMPGYDENAYVDSSRSNEIPLEKLMADYRSQRAATLAMFQNFNKEELMRTGIANGEEISVLAIGFILIGHPIHHFNVIQERYT